MALLTRKMDGQYFSNYQFFWFYLNIILYKKKYKVRLSFKAAVLKKIVSKWDSKARANYILFAWKFTWTEPHFGKIISSEHCPFNIRQKTSCVDKILPELYIDIIVRLALTLLIFHLATRRETTGCTCIFHKYLLASPSAEPFTCKIDQIYMKNARAAYSFLSDRQVLKRFIWLLEKDWIAHELAIMFPLHSVNPNDWQSVITRVPC